MNLKFNKKAFDLIFIIITGIVLITLDEKNLLENNLGYAPIPIICAYYLGQYSERIFNKPKKQ
jgi:hypothetical protein